MRRKIRIMTAVLAALWLGAFFACAAFAEDLDAWLVRDEGEESRKILVFCGSPEDAAALLDSLHSRWTYYAILPKLTEEEKAETAEVFGARPGVRAPLELNLQRFSGRETERFRLERAWNGEKATAEIVTALRRVRPDRAGVYSRDPALQAFLEEKLNGWLKAAADPAVRGKDRTDLYLFATGEVLDPATGEVRPSGVAPVRESAEEAWGGPREGFLVCPEGMNAEGFLSSGDFFLEDAEQGLWAWVSRDVHLEITRHVRSGPPLSWFETDIRIRPGSEEYLRIFRFPNGRANRASVLVRDTGLIFGINTDFYQIRKSNSHPTGLIVRGGELIYDTDGSRDRLNHLPPLDTLTLTADGGFRLDPAGTLNGRDALAMDATDVLSFGPILVLNGELRSHSAKVGRALEPRTAIGRIGSRHYLILTVEGRLETSAGVNMITLGRMMLARGCREAINLDGGHSSVLMFRGRRLNTVGQLEGEGAGGSRTVYELLGIGREE